MKNKAIACRRWRKIQPNPAVNPILFSCSQFIPVRQRAGEREDKYIFSPLICRPLRTKCIALIRAREKNVSNACVRAQTQHTSIENRWCRLEISEKLEFQQLYDSYPLQCTLGEAARVNFDRRGVDKARKATKSTAIYWRVRNRVR